VTPFSGVVGKGALVTLPATQLAAKFSSLSASLLAHYDATGATTGVKLQVGVSIDEGTSFSDFADLATVAPAANSASPVVSQQYVALDQYKAADALQFRLVNLDATNDATVTVEVREAA
jgi:hypothetical protein